MWADFNLLSQHGKRERLQRGGPEKLMARARLRGKASVDHLVPAVRARVSKSERCRCGITLAYGRARTGCEVGCPWPWRSARGSGSRV